MKITLRKKPLKKGRQSLYLDIYQDGRRWYEFLDLRLIEAKSQADRNANRETLELAQKIKTKREFEAIHNAHGFVSPQKSKADFLAYFQAYIDGYRKKDIRMFQSSKKHFEAFVLKTTGAVTLPAHHVTEALLQDFRDELEEQFSGETPHDYFSKLKQVIAKAVKEGILRTDPSKDIKNSRGMARMKDVLTFEEIQALAKADTAAVEVKRAFLFCCYTGLRWCDVTKLQWRDIKGPYLDFVQSKTGIPVRVNLNDSALKLLGNRGRGQDRVFLLPTSTAANKALGLMVKRAGIEKKITWHCARHSFGTAIVYYQGDVATASKLLGHSSLKYTERYVRIADQMKEDAVNRLPGI